MGYPPFSFEKRVERFWSKVKIAGPNDCWIWTGAVTEAGYGQIHIFISPGVYGKGLAHRFAWSTSYGEIPEGIEVCHECDRPACVNPGHLFLGSHSENMGDCKTKGRMAIGEYHGNAKLTWAAVDEIRDRVELPQSYFAKKYGVHQSIISEVRRFKIWTQRSRGPSER